VSAHSPKAGTWTHAGSALLLLTAVACATPLNAQQPAPAAPAPAPPPPASWSTSTPLRTTIPDQPAGKGGTTVVPRAAAPAAPAAAAPAIPAGIGQIALTAVLTEDGQRIDSGIVWRAFLEKGGPDGRPKFVTESRVPAPVLRLAPGDYLINASFGRANLTRRLSIKPGELPPERFVLNAGGLKLTALVANGEPASSNAVSFEIFSDERDQFGNRNRVVGGVKPGIILRLNSGIYHVISTYGDANAQVRTDVSVEAGKLSDATVAHAVGKATFKLVMRAGGEALADTQWIITTPQGDVVKESVGALPTHMLAPGNYAVTARSQGRTFRRDFTLQHNDAVQVEVLVQ
jgi:hypothetical protein